MKRDDSISAVLSYYPENEMNSFTLAAVPIIAAKPLQLAATALMNSESEARWFPWQLQSSPSSARHEIPPILGSQERSSPLLL